MARRELTLSAPLSARGPVSAPRIANRCGRRCAHSASPRPERVRPVDAVRLAKDELGQKAAGGKTARLRLAALPPPGSGASGGAPGLHEGFYDFAAAVVNPKPSAREHAAQLRGWLEAELGTVQGPGGRRCPSQEQRASNASSRFGRASRATSTLSDAILVDEVALKALPPPPEADGQPESGTFLTSVGTAEPEAGSLEDGGGGRLEEVDRASSEIEICLDVLEKYARETTTESKERGTLLGRARSASASALQRLREIVAACEEETHKVEGERDRLEARVADLDEDNAGLRRVVRRTLADESRLRSEGEDLEGKVSSLEDELRVAQRQTDALTAELEATEGQLRAWEDRRSHGVGMRDACNSPMMRFASFVMGPPPGQDGHYSANEVRRPSTEDSVSASALQANPGSRYGSERPGSAETRNLHDSVCDSSLTLAEETPEPAAVPPCAFPAVVPFLDFSGLDLDYGQDVAGPVARNREHLETHLAMLERDREEALAAIKALQGSVDAALEQALVWVQAVWDSLEDFNSEHVSREMQALGHLRSAIEWLATHPCPEWTKPKDRLAQILEEHEGRIRGALAAGRRAGPDSARGRPRSDELTDSPTDASRASSRKRGVQGSLLPGATATPEASQPRPPMQDSGVQCELVPASPTGGASVRSRGMTSSGSGGALHPGVVGRSRSKAAPASAQGPARLDEASGAPVDGAEAERGRSASPAAGEAAAGRGRGGRPAAEAPDLQAAPAGEDLPEDGPEDDAGRPAVNAATSEADLEAKKMRLLRSPFVEGIDLTTVPPSQRVLLRPDGAATATAPSFTAGPRGLKALQAFIAEVYAYKKTDDQRRDKAWQPRRELYVVLQEFLKQQHGVRNVVHQRSWLLVESLVLHAGYDQTAATFAEFLDGSRDLDELSFYLYCSSVVATNYAEESDGYGPARPVVGSVVYERATRIMELLFGMLPKALVVMYRELQKCARARTSQTALDRWHDGLYGGVFASGTMEGVSRVVDVEDLYKVLLEGWRASLLLLEETATLFSWRQCVLAFIQTDVLSRGWLDPHEVQESEETRLQLSAGASSGEDMRILERTSLGAYVHRAYHRCRTAQLPAEPSQASSKKGGLVPRRVRLEREASEACLQVSREAFESVEKTLGVYLTWLMHSEDLRDLALYNTVKARIYGFRQAAEAGEAGRGAHEFRSLLVLLLSHQFDVQHQRGGLASEHLEWELTSLLTVLRESWRRGKEGGGFGESLEDTHLQSLGNIE